MFSKLTTLAALIAVAIQVAASPAPSAAAAADVPITKYGTIVTFLQTNYGGSNNAVILHVIDGETSLCKIYTNVDTKVGYPVIRSYVATNMTCATYPSADCSGNANSLLSSGNRPDVNINAGSLFCIYSST